MSNPLAKLTNVLNEEKVEEDMFYDLLSSSGWSREEVDEMELTPDDLDLEEWSDEEFVEFIRKWLSKITNYYVEYHELEDQAPYFSFHNAVARMINNMVNLPEKAKEQIADLDQNYLAPFPTLKKDLSWAVRYVCLTVRKIPEMKVPEKGIAISGPGGTVIIK